jgi:hypothetical protein
MSADPSRQAKTPASVDDLLRAWGLRRPPFAADEKSREIFAQASIDRLAEASDAIPRTLNLLAQSAWFIAARAQYSKQNNFRQSPLRSPASIKLWQGFFVEMHWW